jgi:hypothetical protein
MADSDVSKELEMVRRLLSSGRLEEIIQVARGQLSAEPPVPQAMTDASKRGAAAISVAEDEDYFDLVETPGAPAVSLTPLVLQPSASTPYPNPGSVGSASSGTPAGFGQLPSGILSLAMWGKTVCELPKVKHLDMSYEELAMSTEAPIIKYLKWITGQGKSKTAGALVVDLASFLKAWKESTSPASPSTLGQLSRRFKA